MKYQINPNFFYSNQGDKVNIVSLDDDEYVYTLDGVAAQIFPKLADGEEVDKVKDFVLSLDNCPSSSEVDSFFKEYTDNLLEQKILQLK